MCFDRFSSSRLKGALKKVPGLVFLVRLCRLVRSPIYRSEWLLIREKPDNLFQPYSETRFNRYPGIFSFVCQQLSNVKMPRLLSYGCSRGEEVFTLRDYFPAAEIVGIDINSRNISICHKKLKQNGDSRICFKQAGSPVAEPVAFYDAIFCMAVLQHGGLRASNAENCAYLITFADFEQTVAGLSQCLKPGGYLTIRFSNFRFSDTWVAKEFDAVFSLNDKSPRLDTPIYGSDNQRIVDGLYNEAVFRKRIVDICDNEIDCGAEK